MLMQHILEVSRADGAEYVYMHVQTNNTEARAFYEKFGFVVDQVCDDYYKLDKECKSAWLLKLLF